MSIFRLLAALPLALAFCLPAYAAEVKYVKVNGADIAYTEAGEGQPLVMLHGGGFTSASWQGVLAPLSARYRVITPDTRGHGASTNPNHEFSYRLLGDDVAAFCKALNLKNPYILGFSDGGIAAMTTAIFHPETAKAYIFFGAMPPSGQADLDRYRQGMLESYAPINKTENITDEDLDAMVKAAPDMWGFMAQMHAKPGEPEYWRTLMKDVWYAWNRPEAYAYTPEQLGSIKVPALVLMGDRDQFMNLNGAVKLYLNLPQGELAVVPNAGHGIFLTQPELFVDNILNFLGRVDSGK